MNLSATGPQPQKARFLREVAQALDFLATFYSLPVEQQEELIARINKMDAEYGTRETDPRPTGVR